jgi:hypothetical protein
LINIGKILFGRRGKRSSKSTAFCNTTVLAEPISRNPKKAPNLPDLRHISPVVARSAALATTPALSSSGAWCKRTTPKPSARNQFSFRGRAIHVSGVGKTGFRDLKGSYFNDHKSCCRESRPR